MKSKVNKSVCYSHIGKRPNHEDNFLFCGRYLTSDMQQQMSDNRLFYISEKIRSKVCMFAVSDGMGGHQAGEVASRICVEKLAMAEKKIQKCSQMKEAIDCIQSAIAEINNIVCERSCSHAELKGMGATLVIFIIFNNEYAVLNIGDSRAYYYDGNSLIKITKDNTEGQRMLDLGLLTRKELEDFPTSKNLNRYIGYGHAGYTLKADVYCSVIEKGTILLCSDGISDFVPDEKIMDILQSEHELSDAGKRIVLEAVSTDYSDNATAILIPLGGNVCGTNKFNWTKNIRIQSRRKIRIRSFWYGI